MAALRVALLSYRSKPHCGGQGIYIRHLSRELTRLGHHVEVFSGPPYPELDDGVVLTKVPSLDLYREPDPFRLPRPSEIHGPLDVLELATMWTAGFAEPLTFTLRAARLLKARAGEFDVVHDNQSLGFGLLQLRAVGLPVVATLHHPITIDRRHEIAAAPFYKQLTVRRWYGFHRMQRRVSRRLEHLITVSENSLRDFVTEFGLDPARLRVIPVGVDTQVFRPPADGKRVPGRLVAMASADVPQKGQDTLLKALAIVVRQRDVHLTIVGRPKPGGGTEKLVAELGLATDVDFVSGLTDDDLGGLVGSAEIAVVPSLYEGFSLPAIEALAAGTALVATRAGALPEVVGECAKLVAPGAPEEMAKAIVALLDDPAGREQVGRYGRARVQELYSWAAAAALTAEVYAEAVAAGC